MAPAYKRPFSSRFYDGFSRMLDLKTGTPALRGEDGGIQAAFVEHVSQAIAAADIDALASEVGGGCGQRVSCARGRPSSPTPRAVTPSMPGMGSAVSLRRWMLARISAFFEAGMRDT